MLRQFVQKVEEMRRLIENQRSASFLLAVSGGMDSMCLLDLFSKTLPASDFAIAHCNFSLRGDESDGDQALVEARAAELGVRLFIKRFDTVSYAQEHGVSIEMAARELRYVWFDELCREHGFDVLSVAHNANDNAETLMLNLLRGTGLNGLHGMHASSPIATAQTVTGHDIATSSSGHDIATSSSWYDIAKNGFERNIATRTECPMWQPHIFRPLLEFTRKQIEGYVFAHKVPYRHDSSNFESDYKRNRIRNEVFPVFEKINPSFIRTLNREIGYFAEAGSIVEDWCRSQLPNVLVSSLRECPSSICPPSDCNLTVSLPKLLATPHWRYLLYYILEPYGFNSQTVASVEDLLDSDRTVSGKRFDSPTHTLLTARDSLMVVPSESRSAFSKNNKVPLDGRLAMSERSRTPLSSVANQGETALCERVCESDDVMVVRGCGIYNFNGARFSVELLDRTPDMPLRQPAGTLVFDADTLQIPFVCRRWRQGDWFVPLGMRGKKKVSDLFADLKFNAIQKDRAVIFVDTHTPGLAEQQHIVALLGHRIDDRYKVTSSTRAVLRITVL